MEDELGVLALDGEDVLVAKEVSALGLRKLVDPRGKPPDEQLALELDRHRAHGLVVLLLGVEVGEELGLKAEHAVEVEAAMPMIVRQSNFDFVHRAIDTSRLMLRIRASV